MVSDKEKLLMVMSSLEKDYDEGKISEEKYRYFKTKYEERLHSIDAVESRDNFDLMREKSSPQSLKRKDSGNLTKKNKQTQQDLVQKYIINPKKGDKDLNKTKRKPMDPNTFKLIAVLVLIMGFTCGIGYGIFNLDYDGLSPITAEAICEDTAFPEIKEVTNKTNTTNNTSYTSNSNSSYSNNNNDSSYNDYSSSGSKYKSNSFSSSQSDSKSYYNSDSKVDSTSSNKYHSSDGSSSSSSSNKYHSSEGGSGGSSSSKYPSSGGDSSSSSKGQSSGGSVYG